MSHMRPSGVLMFQEAPRFHSEVCVVPTQYIRVNSGLVSVSHTFSAVERMQVT